MKEVKVVTPYVSSQRHSPRLGFRSVYTGGYQQWRGGLPEQMCNHIATHSVKPEQPEIKSAKSGQLVD